MSNHYLEYTFQDLGNDMRKSLDVVVCVEWYKGEAPTREDPGFESFVEFQSVEVKNWFDRNGERMETREDWKPYLHKLAERLVDENFEQIISQETYES